MNAFIRHCKYAQVDLGMIYWLPIHHLNGNVYTASGNTSEKKLHASLHIGPEEANFFL